MSGPKCIECDNNVENEGNICDDCYYQCEEDEDEEFEEETEH